MLTTQRRQASSKITVWLVFAGQFCLFISPEPQRILRLTHSSCFSALAADNINCQLLKMCNGMHTVPLRIYAPVSLKSCCNLRNCLAFCGLIACLLHCGIVQLLKGGLKACVLKQRYHGLCYGLACLTYLRNTTHMFCKRTLTQHEKLILKSQKMHTQSTSITFPALLRLIACQGQLSKMATA